VALLLAIAVVAVFGRALAPYDPDAIVAAPYLPPSAQHWLGTNDIGQDLLSELLAGAATSLTIGLVAASAAVAIGTAVGAVAGTAGGWLDALLMRITDVVLTLPFLPLVIVLATFLGPSLWTTATVLALVIWARPARVVRSQALAISGHAYVEAAHALGGRLSHVLTRHVLPGVAGIALSQFVLAVSGAVLAEASLAFLGLGDPVRTSWGSILFYAQSRGAFLSGSWPWWVLPPGLMIAATVLAFALVGRALERVLQPRVHDHAGRPGR
jgi:peptide/nickel transport system ATP-binding protein/peptide/nickel transport system permease protein